MLDGEGLSRVRRIRQRPDFERAYETGRKLRSTLLTVFLVGCGDDGGDGDDAGADGRATTTSAGSTDTTEQGVATFEWDVTSVDFGYELATAEVPAGPVDVIQTNEGTVDHQVTILRLDDGQTPEQLTQLIADEGDDVLDPSTFAGGPNGVPAGGSASVRPPSSTRLSRSVGSNGGDAHSRGSRGWPS